jgi:RHS repeat-associated protein
VDSSIDVSAKRYRYTGMERDEETGLAYHTARYYASWLGRWTASDKLGLTSDLDRFCYCSGHPTAVLDLNGQTASNPPADECPEEMNSSYMDEENSVDTEDYIASGNTDLVGVVQVAGGAIEVVLGGVMMAGGGLLGIAGGTALAVHGFDTISAGRQTLRSDNVKQPETEEYAVEKLKQIGMGEGAANVVVLGVLIAMPGPDLPISTLDDGARILDDVAQVPGDGLAMTDDAARVIDNSAPVVDEAGRYSALDGAGPHEVKVSAADNVWPTKQGVDINDILTKPESLWGKSAEEIADGFSEAGFRVKVRISRSAKAQIVEISGHPQISQIQVHPGGGRHGGAYLKISTTTEGKIKVVDPKTYKPTPDEKVRVVSFNGGDI